MDGGLVAKLNLYAETVLICTTNLTNENRLLRPCMMRIRALNCQTKTQSHFQTKTSWTVCFFKTRNAPAETTFKFIPRN